MAAEAKSAESGVSAPLQRRRRRGAQPTGDDPATQREAERARSDAPIAKARQIPSGDVFLRMNFLLQAASLCQRLPQTARLAQFYAETMRRVASKSVLRV
jgi:hypothetical protein